VSTTKKLIIPSPFRKRTLVAILAVAVVLVSGFTVIPVGDTPKQVIAPLTAAASGSSTFLSPQEAQGWRTVNDHIHTACQLPMLSKLDSFVSTSCTTLLHNRVGGELTFLRWGDETNVIEYFPMSVVGTGESEQKVVTNITMNPAKFTKSGWREIRVTSNFVASNGDREFTTTRVCVFVANGNPRSDYCNKGEAGVSPTAAGRCGAGAWYAATLYSVVFVDCRDVWKSLTRSLSAGDTIRVKAQTGTGLLYVNLDPVFHANNPGTPLIVGVPSGTTATVTIPSGLSPGLHKLHMRDERLNGEAGIYVLPFTISG